MPSNNYTLKAHAAKWEVRIRNSSRINAVHHLSHCNGIMCLQYVFKN